MLQLTSLEKAITSLKEVLEEYEKTKNIFVRDACIQRFEYTYELSHKMLKRHLEMSSANPAEIDQMSFQDLIRTGCEKALLLHGWGEWKLYRKARGATSHAYDEGKALDVLSMVPAFFEEAKYLFEQLEKQNLSN